MDKKEKGRLVIENIKKMHKQLKRYFLKVNEGRKITGTQGMLVNILMRYGDMKVSDLSEKMYLSNSTVSGIVDRLEKISVVNRKRSEEDRRKVMVSLHPDYLKKAKERFNSIDNHFSQIMQKASHEELDVVIKGFEILARILNEEELENMTQEKTMLC